MDKKVPTYPICSICGTFQGTYDDDLIKHQKEVHGVTRDKKTVDYKEALKDIAAKESELVARENALAEGEKELKAKEQELIAREEEVTKREKAAKKA